MSLPDKILMTGAHRGGELIDLVDHEGYLVAQSIRPDMARVLVRLYNAREQMISMLRVEP